jgi:diguanylate cyclase (GGDEF)-like protein
VNRTEDWIRRFQSQLEEDPDLQTSEEPKARAKSALYKLLELSLPPTPENFTRYFYEKDLPSMEDLFRKLLGLTICLAETSNTPSLSRDLKTIQSILDSGEVALTSHPRIESLLNQMLEARTEERARIQEKSRSQEQLLSPAEPGILEHDAGKEPFPGRKRPLYSHRLSDPEDAPDPGRKFYDTRSRPGPAPERVASTLEDLSREALKLQSQMDHIRNLVQSMENRMGTLQKHNRKVSREANIDPLTGILNRRGLQHRLSFLKDPVLSLLIFDLDDFKAINDTYGHNAGDEVLRKIAQGVRTLVRKVDLFSRFGGDEFIVVMPALEISQARFVAERIRSTIARMPVLLGTGSVTITASFGLTGTYVDGAQKMDDLLELADSALYQAKSQGKNQICATNPIP